MSSIEERGKPIHETLLSLDRFKYSFGQSIILLNRI